MSNVTYHPVPMFRWTPIEGGSDHAMVSRLLEQWMLDGRRKRIGGWDLALWTVEDRAFSWLTATDMTCAPPNHEPRSFDLVPSLDWTARRKAHVYCGAPGYVTQIERHLERDTWYAWESGTEPDVWLIEVRWIEELQLCLAAAIEYGNGLVRGWAVSQTAVLRDWLAMNAIQDAIGDRCFPEVIVLFRINRHVAKYVRRIMHDLMGGENPAVISMEDFHTPAAEGWVNVGVERLVSCGREFLLGKEV